jgi:hypothetical protein
VKAVRERRLAALLKEKGMQRLLPRLDDGDKN